MNDLNKFKVPQLKHIITDYNLENPNNQIKNYRSKTKSQLILLIVNSKINLRKYNTQDFNPIEWNSAKVTIPNEMFIKKKGKVIKANILTEKTQQISTKDKKPAINIIPSNKQFIEVDKKNLVIEDHKYSKTGPAYSKAKWGSIDLHVPKQKALYNGDGSRFLKPSVTKNNKLAKQRNQTPIIFETLNWHPKDLFKVANDGAISESKKNIKEVIKEYIWQIITRQHRNIVPILLYKTSFHLILILL